MTRLLLVALACAGLLASPAIAATYSIVPNEAPIAGQAETFTSVYPQSARQKWGQKQPWNPQVELVCGGSIVGIEPMQHESKNPDGSWTGISYPIVIPADATYCTAAVYSYDKSGLTVWASTYFVVA